MTDGTPSISSNSIPTGVDDITADWLNHVLGNDDSFGTITSIGIEHFGEGVGILGELARITITYADGHTGPATIVAKCQSPSPENQMLATVMGFYLREVNFYRHLADDVDLRVPHPYHADAGEGGVPFVLLIEDIVGARCPDQLTGLSIDEARAVIGALVPLHARYWDSPDLDDLDWLPPMNYELYKGGRDIGLALWTPYVERFGERVGPQMLAALEVGIDRYIDMLEHVVSFGASTFTHTDCRAENYLFGGSAGHDAITVIDFQLSTRHWGMWDVANLISGSLDPELRRRHEHEIVAWYVDQLNSAGVEYGLADALHQYRWCLLHIAVAGVIVSDIQGGNERGTQLLEQLFLRPVAAARDNAVWELLAELD
jgi:hypothetical protein